MLSCYVPQWREEYVQKIQGRQSSPYLEAKKVIHVLNGVLSDEFARWIEDGRIPVAKIEKRKRQHLGQKYTIEVKLFDPEVVRSLVNNIPDWRFQDSEAKRQAERERIAREKAAEDERLQIAKELRAATGFSDFPSLFPLARRIKRKLVFLCGPTNSGKTYEALKAACEAQSAEILSPLRLLALEHRDFLRDSGLKAGLITGEEKQIDSGATHIARTIETADFSYPIEVAVIDEIQMLDDEQRGWAWTAAAIGIPAATVYMTGGQEAETLVKKLAKMTGEDLEIRYFERKTPLIAKGQLRLHDLKQGDAVIVFSRKDAHDVRQAIRQQAKLPVATIYGALGPEVRKAEAKRFTSGEAAVLVATDSIGMGLNLGTIQRVLFTSTKKFDGKELRRLKVTEIKQIGGRAGRFGKTDVGYVGTVQIPGLDRTRNFSDIEFALNTPAYTMRSRMLISPNKETVRKAAAALGSKSLPAVLTFLNKYLAKDDSNLEIADIGHILAVARQTDDIKHLDIGDRFIFTCAPTESDNGALMSDLRDYMRAYANNEACGFDIQVNLKELERCELGAKRLSLYIWLAMKWPSIFVAYDEAIAFRTTVQDEIEKLLYASSIPAPKKTPEQIAAKRERQAEKQALRAAKKKRKKERNRRRKEAQHREAKQELVP